MRRKYFLLFCSLVLIIALARPVKSKQEITTPDELNQSADQFLKTKNIINAATQEKQLENLSSISTEKVKQSPPSSTTSKPTSESTSPATFSYEPEYDHQEAPRFDETDSIKEKLYSRIEETVEKSPENIGFSFNQKEEPELESNANQTMSAEVKTRYCADLSPIKHVFDTHIEPLCGPLVNLMPEDLQVILSERIAFLGLSKASCAFLVTILVLIYSTWFMIMLRSRRTKRTTIQVLNMRLVALSTEHTQLTWTKDTYASVIRELEEKLEQAEKSVSEKEDQFSELYEKYEDLLNSHGDLAQNAEQNGVSEFKLKEQLDSVTRELEDLKEQQLEVDREANSRLAQVETSLREKDTELDHLTKLYQTALSEHANCQELVSKNESIKAEVEKLNQTVRILKSSLVKSSRHNSTQLTNGHHDPNVSGNSDAGDESIVSVDSFMQIAQLQLRVKELEEAHEARSRELTSTAGRLADRERSIDALKAKLRDSELQIKMARELREQDTKQHVKTMNDMETQLKKKSTEAEKVTHLLEQIKLKQERLQELEAQFARIERQSNQERQTYEKQAHENWLNGRKVDKELKDTKTELSSIKEKFNEIFNENVQLKQALTYSNQKQQHMNPAAMFYASPPHARNTNESISSNFDDSNYAPGNTSQLNVTSNTNDISVSEAGLNRPLITTTLAEQPLQVDTTVASGNESMYQWPSSNSSNQSGGNKLPGVTNPFMRTPFMYPPFVPAPIPPPNMAMAAAFYHQQQLHQQQHLQQQQQFNDPKVPSPNQDSRLSSTGSNASGQALPPSNAYFKTISSKGSNHSSSQQASPGGASGTALQNFARSASYNHPNINQIQSNQTGNTLLNDSQSSYSNFNISTIPTETDSPVSHGPYSNNYQSLNLNSTSYSGQQATHSLPAFIEEKIPDESYNDNFNV